MRRSHVCVMKLDTRLITEQMTAGTVHSSVVRAADCRSAGPWVNTGRRSWFTFMTWSNNQIIQMINIMSPIRTITRKSVDKKGGKRSEKGGAKGGEGRKGRRGKS